MKRTRFYIFICFAMFASVLVAGCAWWFQPSMRQQRLDAQLLAAIRRDDTNTVATLLDEGANPNAQGELEAVHSPFRQWLRDKFGTLSGTSPAPKYVFSAFDMALFQPDVATPDIALATTLLEHGAKLKNPYRQPFEIIFSRTDAMLDMPYGGTSWQSADWRKVNQTMAAVIAGYKFKGTAQQIDAFVQAAIKAGAKPERW